MATKANDYRTKLSAARARLDALIEGLDGDGLPDAAAIQQVVESLRAVAEAATKQQASKAGWPKDLAAGTEPSRVWGDDPKELRHG